MRVKLLFIFLLYATCFMLHASFVRAEGEFTTDYKTEYFPTVSQSSVATHVKLTLTVTNQRSDVYVRKIAIAFPKSFGLTNIRSTGTLTPEITTTDTKINVQLEFGDPAIGKGNANVATMEFDQDNLFKVNGNVWEVILPTIEDKARSSYKISVTFPPETSKRIAISKPKPDEIKDTTITWNNPTVKTIYAVFGTEQFYDAKLTYHIENSKLIPVYTEVAFPPDTSYQKIYLNQISPAPDLVYTDTDGNMMGRYYLKPKERKDIAYDGIIELFNQARDENQEYMRQLFESQKEYLLTQKSYWKLANSGAGGFSTLKTPESIDAYLVSNFSYNYQKVNKDIKRLGAQEALTHPDQVVCTEFSDSFIALARDKGIYSREIQGYGYSNDPQLRPLSAVADVLHSWPEYYDPKTQLWVQIDPTWQSTSGIDYFSSLDYNHIAFVIHGKRPDYPIPAGGYKLNANSRDIDIKPVATKPIQKQNVKIAEFSLPGQITDNGTYRTKLSVQNTGNVYIYGVPLSLQSDAIYFSHQDITIPALAPYEKKEIQVEYSARNKNKKETAEVTVSLLEGPVYKGKIVVIPYYYDIALKVGAIILAIGMLLFIFQLARRLMRRSA